MCSFRKVGISPGWISCELCLLHQASAPKGVEGGTPNQDLTCQICLATLLMVVVATCCTLPNPPASTCRSSLGCMIGRRAGTV